MPGLPKSLSPGHLSVMDRRGARASLLGRLMREPLVHFLCIGAALFCLYGLKRPAAPSPEAGPGRIVITEDDLRQLAGLWRIQWGRAPTPDELRRLVDGQVREEVYVRQALAAGLAYQDILVRRRLAFLAASEAGGEAIAAPTEAQLREFYVSARDSFAPVAELTFRQIYFSDRVRSGRSKEEAILARDALAGRDAAEPAAGRLGDLTEFPDRLEVQTPDEVAALFGQPFAAALTRLPAGSWQGPVPSQGGWHLVFIEKAVTGPVPPFEAVREQVEQAFKLARREQDQQQAYAVMRARYVVELPPSLAGGGP